MPLVTLTPIVYIDLLLAIDICPVEVSGLGDMERYGDEWSATSLAVFPQKCSESGTMFDPLAYNRYLANLAKTGRVDEIDSKVLWWHSHVRSSAEFSFVDQRYIAHTFGVNVPRSAKNPWLVSIVGNKFRQLGVRLDIFRPARESHENVPIRLTEFTPLEKLQRLYIERRPRMEVIIRENVEILPERERTRSGDDGDRPDKENDDELGRS